MSRILVVDDDQELHQVVAAAVGESGFQIWHSSNTESALSTVARRSCDLLIVDLEAVSADGLSLLKQARETYPQLKILSAASQATNHFILASLSSLACDLVITPLSREDLRTAITAAIDDCHILEMKVVSARQNWVQLRVPCDLNIVPILQRYISLLQSDLPEETCEGIVYAFREMLNNAIEHGGKLDPASFVEVRFIRMRRAIIVWMRDPGEGFDIEHLSHAAVGNPEDDPFRHVLVRDEKGLRAGGFGILLTHQLVDELVYNERCNELTFIKYI